MINAVSNIQRNGDRIVVERVLEDEVEVIDLPLPAVLCVTSDINTPRIPSMKAILGAGKSPSHHGKPAILAGRLRHR